MKINGKLYYLWRAVDHEGKILDSFVTKTRDKAAALTFTKKALKRHGSLEAISTDGLASCKAAMQQLGHTDKQEIDRWAKNRVENSQLPFRRPVRAILRFRRMKTLKKFAPVPVIVHSHVSQERHFVIRQDDKSRRSAALTKRRMHMALAVTKPSIGASPAGEFASIGQNSKFGLHRCRKQAMHSARAATIGLSMKTNIDQTNDVARSMLFLFATAILLWPMLLNGQPLLLDDSASYLRGGGVGLSAGLAMVQGWIMPFWPSASSAEQIVNGGNIKIAEAAIAGSGGARSVTYSLASYMLRAPGNSMAGLALAQAACVAFLILKTQTVIAPGARLPVRFLSVAALAVSTSAAWYASTAMPDIFGGILILAIVLLMLFLDNLSVRSRLALVLVIAGAITVHASHVPIALAMLIAGTAIAALVAHRKVKLVSSQSGWMIAPLILGMGVLVATSYVGFGEASLVPKRYPITLARSVNDGPGLWHLQKSCATERYAVCEVFGANIPRGIDEFLWGPNGLRMRATPSQMERIRAEEMLIVRRAAAEYPLMQVWRASVNLGHQLWSMGLSGLRLGLTLAASDRGRLELVKRGSDWPVLRHWAEQLTYVSFFASLVAIGTVRKQLKRSEIGAISLVVTGLIVNAGVCGILSAVTDRYQGRVAWVLPVVTLAILLRLYASRDRAKV